MSIQNIWNLGRCQVQKVPAESVPSDPEESIEQAPIPAARRSLRNRKRPAWMDSCVADIREGNQ